MNKNIRHGIFVLIGLVIGLIATSFVLSSGKSGMAYARMDDLYNSFEMKQNLENNLKSIEQARKFITDSMLLDLQAIEVQLKNLPKTDTLGLRIFSYRQQEYMQRKQEFEEDNIALAQQYTDQIWAQISQYSKDFGKENGYSFILGAAGDGVLMYADESKDLTETLKIYINEKYHGQTKIK
ncbi:MAG: OmpH family outer membrane protein [Bacteroidota bacterium]|nr:OmpH family outer membrane protein [Bacteroidota bacterium]